MSRAETQGRREVNNLQMPASLFSIISASSASPREPLPF